MVNKPFVQWFIRIFCVYMALNMLLTAVSACLVPGIDTIVYSCSGEDACIIQLDFERRQVRYMKYTSEFQNSWMTGEMSDFMAFRLKFAAAFSNLPLWLENYGSGEDSAEKAWAMDIYSGNRVKSTRGNGDYPLKGNLLISRLNAIAELFPEQIQEPQKAPSNVNAAEI